LNLILSIVCGLLTLPGFASSATQTSPPPDPRLAGGATTVFDASTNAFSLPAANTSQLRQNDFFVGNAIFQQPWVIAPASTKARDGLGPLFNTNSCQGCHVKDGKGHPPLTPTDGFLSTLVRLSIPAETDADKAMLQKRGAIPDPVYGDQLQPYGITGVKGEGTPHFEYQEIHGTFKDGEAYTLLQPKLLMDDLNYGALHPKVQMSARVAPAMTGLGLLEAIPEAAILANADPDDANADGISGRPNHVWDMSMQKTVLGRFGWKANQPSVAQQTVSAFNTDIGIASDLLPAQACTDKQTACRQAPDGGKPEIPRHSLQTVVYYASLLAVPARRDVNDTQVLQGQKRVLILNNVNYAQT
jgi:CxxC motif-containing protein (DUF1111 family)